MIKHRSIDAICAVVMILAIITTLLFMNGEVLGLAKQTADPPYVHKIFNQDYVHTIDIQLDADQWQSFLESATDKEYISCSVIIDGETFDNVGLRAKGNNSLHQTEKYGSYRYSLKIEFDHFSAGYTYHGLDKLSLNGSFQDNAFLKDYMAYEMMRYMGVPAPLCSYAFVTVGGEDWGLFVAIEEMEEAFAKRVYGKNHGQLYKPDYMSINHENNDVALIYTDDDYDSYYNIFRNAKFKINDADKARLIASLQQLSTGENLESVIDVDEVLRYFVVQSFVVNLDGYLGPTGHNYYLYEKDGKLQMLPWDYNLAYATYALGMPNPVNDSTLFVNYPIDTPAPGNIMLRRPMFHNLMLNNEYFNRYHRYYASFINGYFDTGQFSAKVWKTVKLIAPYVQRDPTKFCSYDSFMLAVQTFEAFCLLRAQSVSGQLDGSIPSTIRGQELDQSALIDASHISVPDMGNLGDMENLYNK